jgi:hypothetical protein
MPVVLGFFIFLPNTWNETKQNLPMFQNKKCTIGVLLWTTKLISYDISQRIMLITTDKRYNTKYCKGTHTVWPKITCKLLTSMNFPCMIRPIMQSIPWQCIYFSLNPVVVYANFNLFRALDKFYQRVGIMVCILLTARQSFFLNLKAQEYKDLHFFFLLPLTVVGRSTVHHGTWWAAS